MSKEPPFAGPKFAPLGNRILAEVVTTRESKGGIQLPDMARGGSKEAIIISMGGKTSNNLKIGDKIMFSRSLPITVDEKQYIIVVEDDVVGVFGK
jgi:co-chaperonin GroES (HSP10)